MAALSTLSKGGLILALSALDILRSRRDLLPVLNYHAIDGDRSPVSLPPAEFEKQMCVLAQRGITTLTFAEAVNLLRQPDRLPRRTVCLTFDDGLQSVYTAAYPILRRHGFRATVFLTTGAENNRVCWERDASIPQRPLMEPEQVRELAAAGFEIGAHTRTHPHLTDLDEAALENEVAGNRDDVTALCGVPPATFAYPYGDYDERVIEAVRRAGFTGACTVELPGRRMLRDPFRVERIDVSRFSGHRGRLARISFAASLSGVFGDYVRLKGALPHYRSRTFEYKERKRKDALR